MVNRQNQRMNMMRTNRQGNMHSYNNGMQNVRLESGNNGCMDGCNTMGNDCKAIMRRLQKIDFSIVDTVLYLDMYPDCRKALDYYHKLLSERDALRSALSEKCKRPMSSFENTSDCTWDWISSPWPWEASAN